MRLLDFWQKFLDSLDTQGGHIMLLLLLFVGLSLMARFGVPKAETYMEGMVTTLMYAMRGGPSNVKGN